MAINRIIVALLIAVAISRANSKTPTLPGPCPDISAMASLDTNKTNGDWYIVQIGKQGFEKSSDSSSSDAKKCFKKTISLNSDKTLSSVTSFKNGDRQISITATANPVSGQTGKFITANDTSEAKVSTATILDTDYTNYCVGVTCKSEGDFHGILVEITSRQKTLDNSFLAKAKAALDAAKISIDLREVDQTC